MTPPFASTRPAWYRRTSRSARSWPRALGADTKDILAAVREALDPGRAATRASAGGGADDARAAGAGAGDKDEKEV
ncbi:hypothetical protein [Streptomyces sp. NPDC058745]|uniref:hypothetical protein n=1 Tax=Streptomyces sp. NPDC058745 TaxID=3346621 RepID=UPI0036B63B4C